VLTLNLAKCWLILNRLFTGSLPMSSDIALAIQGLIRELEQQVPLPSAQQDPTAVAPTVDLPRGALYSARPPTCPRAGTYCFPTGVLLLASGGLAALLGLPLQRVRSARQRPHQQQWRCRCCGMVISVHIGPFLISVVVRPRPLRCRLN
jgi:hypothetical protein